MEMTFCLMIQDGRKTLEMEFLAFIPIFIIWNWLQGLVNYYYLYELQLNMT